MRPWRDQKRRGVGILQRGDLLPEAAHLSHCFREFVGQHQRRHHRKARIADFTETLRRRSMMR